MFRKFQKIFLNPIAIFVILLLLCITSIVLWVVLYVTQHSTIQNFTSGLTGADFNEDVSLVLLTAGITLLGVILIGTIFLSVFAIKQGSLYAQQRSFLSSVTHELRSPLASMQLSLETLKLHKVPQEIVNKLYDMALIDIKRLSTLVDELLVSSRLDRGIHMFESVEEIYLIDVFEEAIQRVRHISPEVRKRLHIECDKNFSIMSAKPALNLVVGNLLENAIKYSPQSTPIELSAFLDKTNSQKVKITVKDHGFGIEKVELIRIFKMFYRGKISSKKAIAGTGLGLYIVKSITKLLGGSIKAESKGINLGSKFTVTLPSSILEN